MVRMKLLENFPFKDHIPLKMRSAVVTILFSHFFIYEKDVVNFYKQFAPYKVAVDIGASCGYHTKRLAKLADKVIAIEPFNELKKMPPNVEIHKVAVGRKEGIVNLGLLFRGFNFTNAIIDSKEAKEVITVAKEFVKVKMVRLDSIVTKADFLKIDVEGYELEVLKGAKVMENVKYVAFELHREGISSAIRFQQEIFKLFKDFDVYFSDKDAYVTKDDIPLSPEYGHLFCIRRGMTDAHLLKIQVRE